MAREEIGRRRRYIKIRIAVYEMTGEILDVEMSRYDVYDSEMEKG
ncbi:hypothetical protein HRbin02_01614 [Candidatus Calditenuaceae archaeon HR02]|nr:hypothetical protein HRbin02_01614 [Candidatus Calditenuaceae archaeon HR02]